MRGLPFFKPKNIPQFAGMNFSNDTSGGDGGGAVDFSLTPQFTGRKWIDNKPTKVVTIPITSFSSSSHEGNADVSDLNIETVVNISGIIPGLGMTTNNFDENGYYTSIRYRADAHRIYCKIVGFDSTTAYVTIEYTTTN